jgi:hypothetical protein
MTLKMGSFDPLRYVIVRVPILAVVFNPNCMAFALILAVPVFVTQRSNSKEVGEISVMLLKL